MCQSDGFQQTSIQEELCISKSTLQGMEPWLSEYDNHEHFEEASEALKAHLPWARQLRHSGRDLSQ
jgi:hypothetical protein